MMTNEPRKIFIDGGAYDGKTSRDFAELNPDFEIFAFEPDPESLRTIQLPEKAVLIKKAIWNKDEMREFEFGLGVASNVLSRWNKPTTNIECIDFIKWLENNFKPEDYVIIKLDIEGAEHLILDGLLRSNLIDELFIEWHNIAGYKIIEDPKIKIWKHNVKELNKKVV